MTNVDDVVHVSVVQPLGSLVNLGNPYPVQLRDSSGNELGSANPLNVDVKSSVPLVITTGTSTMGTANVIIRDSAGNEIGTAQNTTDSTDIDSQVGLVTQSMIHGKISSGTSRPIRLDSSTHTMQQIRYEHHEIHAGNHFFYEDFTTLANGNAIDFGIQTPDSTKETHLVWEIAAQGQFTFEFWEDASITFDGSDQLGSVWNNNRNSTGTTNWVNFHVNPTITNVGTALGRALVGDASNPVRGIPGGGKREREIILKQNAVYLFRITSGVNGNVISYLAEWYNHAAKG